MQQLAALQSFLDVGGEVAVAVVDDGVALAPVDERLDEGLRFAGNADERMNVAAAGQLDGERADAGGGAVDDEGNGLGGVWDGEPGCREAEVQVEAAGGCESG